MYAHRPNPHLSVGDKQPCTFNDFPVEVIGVIFSFCQDDGLAVKPMKYLVGITATCKQWRALAMSIPELWSTFELEITPNSCSPPASVIKSWLRLSGAHPLSMSFIVKRTCSAEMPTSSPSETTYPVLLAAIHRWKCVKFTFDKLVALDDCPPFLSCVQLAPTLEAVEVSSCDGQSNLPPKWLGDISHLMSAAPCLCSFACRGRAQPFGLTVPWARLTHLHLGYYINDSYALCILEETPRLLECSLRVRGLTGNPAGVVSRIPTLTLGVNNELGLFFQSLILPDLKTLEINFDGFDIVWDNASFEIFLSRSLCQITSFTIRNLTVRSKQLLECLRLLSPSLRELKILTDNLMPPSNYLNIENLTEDVLTALTCDSESSTDILCPHLESVVLERCLDAEDGHLSDMIASRWWTATTGQPRDVAKLAHVDVLFRYHTHAQDASRLRKMMKEGLRGRVRYGVPR